MNSQDFLFYSVGIGFLILVGFVSLAAYRLAQSFKKITLILQNAENLSEDISNDLEKLKSGVKLGILNLLQIFLKKRR